MVLDGRIVDVLWVIHLDNAVCKAQFGFQNASLNLLHHLNAENTKCIPNIFHISDCDFFQKWSQLFEGIICGIINPCSYEDTIIRLKLEVLRYIIYYQSF